MGKAPVHFQELSQKTAAGEGLDLSDSTNLQAFQQTVIDSLQDL